MQDVTDATFATDIEQFKGVVLIDFWADWCTPCHMLTPIVEEIATDYQGNGNVKLVKLNVDENQQTAGRFGIMSIPTMLIFKDGTPIAQLVGVQPKEAITEAIEQALVKE